MKWTLSAASELRHSASLRADWDALNTQRGDLPFMAADAICAALAEFGTGAETLALATVYQRTVAMFILEKQGLLRWATFQPSQLPLSAWVAERQLSLQTLTRSLIAGVLSPCLILSVTKIDPLLCERPAPAADALIDDYIQTAWIDIAGSFDDYWAARGKNLKQNMRKQRNKLLAEGTTTAMRILSERDDMAPALARYGALESAGWKAARGTAIHADNAQGRFYRQLFEQAADRGEARVFEYLFNDRVVAMNLCLVRDQVLTVLKTTYAEDVPKALSPAFLLREEELQHFFGVNEVRRIEYYGRVMEWHTKLTDQQRSLYHLSCYRWAWVKRLAERRRRAAEAALPAEKAVDATASAASGIPA